MPFQDIIVKPLKTQNQEKYWKLQARSTKSH
jgi:hypothetical protein